MPGTPLIHILSATPRSIEFRPKFCPDNTYVKLPSRRPILHNPTIAMHCISFLDAFLIISITLPTIQASVSPEHYIVPATAAIHPRLKAERSFSLFGRRDCCEIGCVPDCPDGSICVENDEGDTACCPEGNILCDGGDFICCPQESMCQEGATCGLNNDVGAKLFRSVIDGLESNVGQRGMD